MDDRDSVGEAAHVASHEGQWRSAGRAGVFVGAPAGGVDVLLVDVPGCLVTSLTLTGEMLTAANSILRARRQPPVFRLSAWSCGGKERQGLLETVGARTRSGLLEGQVPDWMVVPAIWGNPQPFLRRFSELRRAVGAFSQIAGRRMIGVGSGAFLLADAGVLDGQSATTHWSQFERFARRYPAVRLRREHRIVESGGRYTVASMNALADLVVHLVGEVCGAEVGRVVERHFSYESRNPFAEEVFSERRPDNVADELVAEVQSELSEDPASSVDLGRLARDLGVSRRTLDRRFRAATGLSPVRYRNRARIELAATLLRSSDLSIREVAERAGVTDRRYFSRLFRSTLGVTPREYRRVVRAKLFRPA